MTRFAGGYAGVCAPVSEADVYGLYAPPEAPMPRSTPPNYDFGGMPTVTHQDTWHDTHTGSSDDDGDRKQNNLLALFLKG
jgi:hypothetical protein